MNKSITFTGNYAPNTDFGINFQAIVDDENVVCEVSQEALQDIDPTNAQDAAEHQFIENRLALEEIAEKKILRGEVVNGRVRIEQIDVR